MYISCMYKSTSRKVRANSHGIECFLIFQSWLRDIITFHCDKRHVSTCQIHHFQVTWIAQIIDGCLLGTSQYYGRYEVPRSTLVASGLRGSLTHARGVSSTLPTNRGGLGKISVTTSLRVKEKKNQIKSWLHHCPSSIYLQDCYSPAIIFGTSCISSCKVHNYWIPATVSTHLSAPPLRLEKPASHLHLCCSCPRHLFIQPQQTQLFLQSPANARELPSRWSRNST